MPPLYILEELKEKLEEHLLRFGDKVRLVRSKERLGLIRAKITGAEHTRGEVVVFLDSHCEANAGWYFFPTYFYNYTLFQVGANSSTNQG
jgi:glycosyltransferase involved in cell wall biosynthesis